MRIAGGQNIGDHQRPRVDEGVARDAFFRLQLHHGVERRARRLAPDALPQRVTHQFECQNKGEKLGDALDGKRGVCAAGFDAAAVNQSHRHAKLARCNLCQRGDVAGNFALAVQRFGLKGDLVEGVL